MLYGIEIDEAYLSRMSQYKGKTVTQADMAKVAIGQKATYQGDAEKKQAEMKGEYGLGVCVLVRIYNATGAPLVFKTENTWRGHFGSQTREQRIGNGQWTVFIHTKSDSAAVGCCGCVIYNSTANKEVFMGWQNPWNRAWESQVFVDVKASGNYWSVESKDKLLSALDNHDGQVSDDSLDDINVHGVTGNDTTAYVEYVAGYKGVVLDGKMAS